MVSVYTHIAVNIGCECCTYWMHKMCSYFNSGWKDTYALCKPVVMGARAWCPPGKVFAPWNFWEKNYYCLSYIWSYHAPWKTYPSSLSKQSQPPWTPFLAVGLTWCHLPMSSIQVTASDLLQLEISQKFSLLCTVLPLALTNYLRDITLSSSCQLYM